MADMTPGTSRTEMAGADTGDVVGGGTSGGRPRYGDTAATGRPQRRLSTETKAAFKTTELWIYAAAVAAVLIASQVVDTGSRHVDYFRADRAWLYIVVLTVGYLLSRGFAKSGSRQPYDE
jgi:hypothetical protein